MTASHKECCCCGGGAGRFEQHWNRDTGYGICRDCADDEIKRGTSPANMVELYGIPGKHYAAHTFQLYGRKFNVLAAFPNSKKGEHDANQFMLDIPYASLLSADGDQIILADKNDKGVEAYSNTAPEIQQ